MKSPKSSKMQLGTTDKSGDKSQDILAKACLEVGLEEFQEIDDQINFEVAHWNGPSKRPYPTEPMSYADQPVVHKKKAVHRTPGNHYFANMKIPPSGYHNYHNYNPAYRPECAGERMYQYSFPYVPRRSIDPRFNSNYYGWPSQQNGSQYPYNPLPGMPWKNTHYIEQNTDKRASSQESNSLAVNHPMFSCRYAVPKLSNTAAQRLDSSNYSYLTHEVNKRHPSDIYSPKRAECPVRSSTSPSSPPNSIPPFSSFGNSFMQYDTIPANEHEHPAKNTVHQNYRMQNDIQQYNHNSRVPVLGYGSSDKVCSTMNPNNNTWQRSAKVAETTDWNGQYQTPHAYEKCGYNPDPLNSDSFLQVSQNKSLDENYQGNGSSVQPSNIEFTRNGFLNGEQNWLNPPYAKQNQGEYIANHSAIELAKRMEKKETPTKPSEKPRPSVKDANPSNKYEIFNYDIDNGENLSLQPQESTKTNISNSPSYLEYSSVPYNQTNYHSYKLSVEHASPDQSVIKYSMANLTEENNYAYQNSGRKRAYSSEIYHIPEIQAMEDNSLSKIPRNSSSEVGCIRSSSEPHLHQSSNTFQSKVFRSQSLPNEEALNNVETTTMPSFLKKLQPVLNHLLSIPEASSLQSLRNNPDTLLSHLLKLWGGETCVSSSEDTITRIKENFSILVKHLFKPQMLVEWGWENVPAENILDDLVQPVEGLMEYKMVTVLKDCITLPLKQLNPPMSDGITDDEVSTENPIPHKKRNSSRTEFEQNENGKENHLVTEVISDSTIASECTQES